MSKFDCTGELEATNMSRFDCLGEPEEIDVFDPKNDADITIPVVEEAKWCRTMKRILCATPEDNPTGFSEEEKERIKNDGMIAPPTVVILEYELICHNDPRIFIKIVNQANEQGWQLHGNPFDSDGYICQMVLKRGVKEED